MFRPLTCVGILVLMCLTACQSGGPEVSGFALGDSRTVKQGEVITIRLPMGADGSRQWRVSSFDSLYLSLTQAPRPEQQPNGSYAMVARARAKTPGETIIEFTDLRPAPGKDRATRRFTVTILQ